MVDTKKITVLGIDPGTANTALVIVQDGAIRAAVNIRTKPSELRDFADLVRRSKEVGSSITTLASDTPAGSVTVAVMESYKDFGGGHKRGVKNRHMTSHTMAYIQQALDDVGIPVIYQDPDVMKKAYKAYLDAWNSGTFGLVQGDEMLTNAHRRDAAVHALYYLDSVDELHMTTGEA